MGSLPFRGFRQLHRHIAVGRLYLFYLTSASIVIEQSGSFVYQTSCDTEHRVIMVISEDLRHTAIAERLAVELSLPVFTSKVYLGWDSNTQLYGASALTHSATATASSIRTLVMKLTNSIK